MKNRFFDTSRSPRADVRTSGIEILAACKCFGGKEVLRDFSLSLPERGTVCLFGPSGCGKTTLLNCVAGFETLDSGTVAGTDGLRLACVFQEDRLLPWCTAQENIAAVLRGTRTENREEARRWLSLSGLGEECERRPAQLSGGMRRRVAIARALAYGGGLFLLDEPFQRLDAAARSRMEELVARATENALCLFVTHDPGEAEKLADTVVFLSGPPLSVKKIQALKKPTG